MQNKISKKMRMKELRKLNVTNLTLKISSTKNWITKK